METNLGQVVLVKDISSSGSSYPRLLTEANDKLYFAVGGELWISDGTSDGTQLLAEPSGFANSPPTPSELIEFNDKLYFVAENGSNGQELFVSDGTSEGTQLLVDINPTLRPAGSFRYSYFVPRPQNLVVFEDKLYFEADDDENGREVWVSDGTAEGTQLLVDLNPGADSSFYFINSSRRNFEELDGKLYFAAGNNEIGEELFVTDGTAEGTQLVADIRPNDNPGSGSYFNGIGSNPLFLSELNGKLYFTAIESENSGGVFVSDGTAEGTQLSDLAAGSVSFNPSYAIEFNGKIYFSGKTDEVDEELFVTDGTIKGTQLVADIRSNDNPSSDSYINDTGSYPFGFVEFNGKLYFSATTDEVGLELFVTDGTPEGTQLVADINPGANSSDPSELTVFGDELFFVADNGETGKELFKLTFDDTVTPTQPLNPIIQTLNNDNLVGTDGDDEIAGDGGNDGITGEGGNDFIDGKLGNDVLNGGAGSDTLDGGAGTDTTVYQFAPAAVTVSLGEGEALGTGSDGYGSTDSLANLENIIGSEFDDNLTGNSSNNSLTGRGGNDAISGLAGDDFLTGSTGADTISGGSGSDLFVYLNANEGGDTIADFAVGTDKIAVVAAGFGGELSAGELPESSFVYGSVATGNDQRFVFNDVSGELFFDADGSGAANQQLIATVGGESKLSAGDIMLL